MLELTRRQRQVLDFIQSALRTSGFPPTLREIADHCGFKSSRAAADHLRVTSPLAKLRSRIADIPLYGAIPAGLPQPSEQEAEGCVSVDIETIGFKPTRNTFALRVSGDSMIGKHICDGDIVVLEHGPDPRTGQIVAAYVDGQSTLKTYVLKGSRPYLRAENPKFPDLIPAQELMIQGVFKAMIRIANE